LHSSRPYQYIYSSVATAHDSLRDNSTLANKHNCHPCGGRHLPFSSLVLLSVPDRLAMTDAGYGFGERERERAREGGVEVVSWSHSLVARHSSFISIVHLLLLLFRCFPKWPRISAVAPAACVLLFLLVCCYSQQGFSLIA
jgi:hypothetical protein